MNTPNDLGSFYDSLRETGFVRRLLELARDEDLGDKGMDITALASESGDDTGRAQMILRESATVSGLRTIPELIEVFGGGISAEFHAEDGETCTKGVALATLTGPLSTIVTMERTMLNLVGRLSGVATLTARFVEAAGPGVEVLDTRKTTPGLRVLEKYAVRCGGGHSHRLGLHDAAMFKDNHLAAIALDDLVDWLTNAAMRAKSHGARFVEVEVDTLEQFREILKISTGDVDMVLLDNMSNDDIEKAVVMRNQAESHIKLEASGGVRLETIRAIADTGVDRISAGALTHQATSIDVGLDMVRNA